MIHEYGHQYEGMRRMDPTPLMETVWRLSRSVPIAKEVERESMRREAFAQACELIGAKDRYPDHYRRLVADAKGPPPSKSDGHREALILAVDMLAGG